MRPSNARRRGLWWRSIPALPRMAKATVWTAEQYYDTPFVDYVMDATGGEGDLEVACQHAIEWSLRLYNHVPPKPVVNGAAWYEGVAGGTAEMTAQLGYLSLLSGNVGYTYGTSLWNATDADIPAWKAFRGATYMQYLYDFFAALDEGRPFQPRHGLIKNQATRYQDRMVLGVSADGMTYAAFLPKGGTISVDLTGAGGDHRRGHVVQSPHRPIPRSGHHVWWGRAFLCLAFWNEPIGACAHGAVTCTAGGDHPCSRACTCADRGDLQPHMDICSPQLAAGSTHFWDRDSQDFQPYKISQRHDDASHGMSCAAT